METIIDKLCSHDNEYIRCLACLHSLRKPVLSAMLDCYPLKGKGLDIGCGIGLVTLVAAKKGLDVTGFDNNPEFIRLARSIAGEPGLKNCPDFIQGDADNLEFENSSFDWTMSMDCVNYATDVHRNAILEMKRVTKPGGRIILSAWSSQMLLPGYPLLEARLNASSQGLAPFEPGAAPLRHFMATASLLGQLGFKDIRCKTFLRDIATPLPDRDMRGAKTLFYMRWSDTPSGLDKENAALYTALTRPESGRFILSCPGYYGFFTYTMFTAIVP